MRLLANKTMLSPVSNRSRGRWGQNRERISRERLSLLSLSFSLSTSSMQLEDELLALAACRVWGQAWPNLFAYFTLLSRH
jgi:hypothetical protein